MKLAEPGHSWKLAMMGGRAPSESAMVRGCLVSMASGQAARAGPVNPKKIPDLCPQSALRTSESGHRTHELKEGRQGG